MTSLYFHFSGVTYQNLIEARLVMEPVMARLAAERRATEHIEQLERFIAGGDEDGDAAYYRHGTEFHSVIAAASGNPLLDLTARSIKDLYTDRLERGLVFGADVRERVHGAHTAIAKAIVVGNAKRAEKLMYDHMVEFLEFVSRSRPEVLSEVVDWR
ncbi:FadR/GntR family transcriptional regulator [Streptomyces chartreusis]|uniref:FadR/GntR family transcriptional regulator n=1 Tax=Streptomyces chartreusis TaxID=1969 RepID=UPI0036297B62